MQYRALIRVVGCVYNLYMAAHLEFKALFEAYV